MTPNLTPKMTPKMTPNSTPKLTPNSTPKKTPDSTLCFRTCQTKWRRSRRLSLTNEDQMGLFFSVTI